MAALGLDPLAGLAKLRDHLEHLGSEHGVGAEPPRRADDADLATGTLPGGHPPRRRRRAARAAAVLDEALAERRDGVVGLVECCACRFP